MTQVNAKKYTKTAIILHWLIGLAILAMFGLGWYMTDLPKEGPEAIAYDLFDWGIYTWQLSEPQSPRMFYYNLHKSIGVTLLALIAFRIFWRQTHRPPALLNTLKAGEKKFVNAMHHLLYVLMFAVPVSGFIMSIYSKFGIIWFESHCSRGSIIMIYMKFLKKYMERQAWFC